MTRLSRRGFLRGSGALTALGGTGLLGLMANRAAHAADTSGYKAIVCVFLYGGMDQFDTLLPTDEASYQALRDVRGPFLDRYDAQAGGSSRARDAILTLNPENAVDFGGRGFGLPRELAGLHGLFEAGNAAIVTDVGPLIEPASRDAIESGRVRIPDRLFSHNDQQSTWMSLGTEGTQFGWGGLMASHAAQSAPSENSAFSAISTTGNQVFLSGDTVRQYSAPVGGSSGIAYLGEEWLLGYNEGSDEARRLLDQHLRGLDVDPASLFRADILDMGNRAVEIDRQFREAYALRPEFRTPEPDSNWLAFQLRTVAEMIAVQNTLNVSRQVFLVGIGGFDTHSNQAGDMPYLHGQISEGLVYFAQLLNEIGRFNDVVTFTASEFGRTLLVNGDGTDHGWAGHQFVMGGPVRGRRIYGDVADYDLDSQRYWESGGRPVPTTSVDQFAATLGRWFGLNNGELAEIFPNLANFDTADLGFMGVSV